MDVTAGLLRFGAGRAHVFIVSVPGATAIRLAVEAEIARRGLRLAASPGDADLLVVAGEAAPELEAAVSEVWAEIPSPRARVEPPTQEDVGAAFTKGLRGLVDARGQRSDAARRADPGGEHGRRRDSDAAAQQGQSVGHEHMGDHGHVSDHGEMGHMDMPGGLPMADRAPDRDGLKLDQLHLALGPVLPDWPAGLSVELTLQGDVVQDAEVTTYVAAGTGAVVPFWHEPWARAAAGHAVTRGEAARRRAAEDLDRAGRLLAVAGWGDAASSARRLRDGLLGAANAAQLAEPLRKLQRRVVGSRLLRWLTAGIGVVDGSLHPLPAPQAERAAGDVPARLARWLEEAVALTGYIEDPSALAIDHMRAADPLRERALSPRPLLDLLPRLLSGVELAAVRLTVASLELDLDLLPAPAAEMFR